MLPAPLTTYLYATILLGGATSGALAVGPRINPVKESGSPTCHVIKEMVEDFHHGEATLGDQHTADYTAT